MSIIAKVRPGIRFGEFEFDIAAGELRRSGSRLRLQDQPLQILQILVQRPSEIVSREELQREIWTSDTFVDFDHGINNAIKRLREVLGDTADTPRYIETLPRRGYRFIGKIELETPMFRSLAVLPLVNLSGDAEQEYFADGMTEALITTLAKIGELRVVSRTSSMLYKGVRKPLREIAHELEVDAIVEGTVLRAGERVRIAAQLIDPSKETHLWAESYDRHLRDILDIQSDVARAVAHEIEVKLTPQERAQLTQAHPVDPEAYEAYLRGRFHWIKRTREGHLQACQHFQQAIAKDPACAPAYAGLADALAIMSLWGLFPPAEGCGKARDLAQKALKIDHSLPEAHTSFAWTVLHYDYDFATAEKEFERAIELNPRYANAHHWFGMSLALMGRYEEGYTELQRAIRLDPNASYIHFGLAFVHWSGRRYDQAIESCHKALELDPNSAQALGWLGLSCTAVKAFDPAIVALQKSAEISQRAPAPVALLGEAYAAAGNCEQAQVILKELTGHRHVSKFFTSRIYTALGQTDAALAMLEAGYREHGEWMPLVKVDQRFDALRSDLRFQKLMRRMSFHE
jgi:TolB-like protein/Flp pilus assembly protein TadD